MIIEPRVHTLSLNPCLVYDQSDITFSGKGLNVARNLRKLGYQHVASYVLVGGRSGEQVLRLLQDAGHAFEFSEIQEPTLEVDIKDPLTSIRRQPENPFVTASELRSIEQKLKDKVRPGDIVVIAGSLPRNVDPQTYKKLIRYFNTLGAITVLDTADRCAFKHAFDEGPTMAKPNRDEILDYLSITDHTYPSAQIKNRINDLVGRVDVLLISLDEEGAILTEQGEKYQAKALETRITNISGAGDALVAGYLFGLIKKIPPKEKLQFAIATATSYIANGRYQGINPEEVLRLQPQVNIERLLE